MKLKLATLLIYFYIQHSYTNGEILQNLMKLLKFKLSEIIDSNIDETRCASDLKIFFKSLQNLEIWALTMLDANSKFSPGLLEGNVHGHGNFDQCLSVNELINNRFLSGQYCTAVVTLKENLKKGFFETVMHKNPKEFDIVAFNAFQTYAIYYFGLCVPSSCSVKDLKNLISILEEKKWFPLKINLSQDNCFSNKQNNFEKSSIDFYIFLFFSIILVMVFMSTIYDIYLKYSGEKINIFVSFSIYSNLKKIFTLETDKRFGCLDGIRSLSLIWIIFGHVIYCYVGASTNLNYFYVEWPKTWVGLIASAGHYAVDTFFALSGLLVVYLNLQLNEHTKITLFQFYSYRFLRLFPPLLATIFINISLVKYMVDGPLVAKIIDDIEEKCKENWWGTLLFINNFVQPVRRCLSQSWFLSVDSHYYLAAPLFIYYLKKSPKTAFLGLFLLVCFSLTYTWFKVVNNNLGFILLAEVTLNEVPAVYISTLCRIPSWFVGAGCGYLIFQNKTKKQNLLKSKFINLTLWCLSLFVITYLVYYHIYFFIEEYNPYRSAFFNSFSRLIWTLAICFITYSCCTGTGGFINSFLSHSIFQILAKISYSIFLIHITVLYTITVNRRQAAYFTNFNLFFEFSGHFVITLLAGVVFSLLFESPILFLLSYKMKRNSKKEL